MSLKLKITNKYNESITLTQNSAFSVAQVTGLTPPLATINTAPIATKDGSLFNSAFLENRNIVILLYPTGAPETQRVNLYRYLKAKQKIRLELETKTRAVYIDGYIESLEGDLYEKQIEVELLSKLRDEQRFDSISELQEQLKLDAERCYSMEW